MRRIASALLLIALAACGDNADAPADAAPRPDAGPPIIEVDAATPDALPPTSPVTVQILAFNDFHGNLEPPAGSSGRVRTGTNPDGSAFNVDAGGASYFASMIQRLRDDYPTAVVSAGNLIGASPLLSALFHDEPTIEAMNLAGLDFSAVGNHEFDEGGAELLRMQYGGCHPLDGCGDGSPFAGARFQFLSANVTVDGANRTLFPRYAIRELGGVPVAFIGMTLEGTPSIVTPLGVAGLGFLDEVATVNALVPELRAAGIEAIVVVVHEGGFQTGLYDQCVGMSGAIVQIAEDLDPAVDVIISGHTHAAYNCEIAGKRVTSALSFGRLLTRLILTLDPVSHDVVTVDAQNLVVERRLADATVGGLVRGYADRSAPLRQRVVGEVTAILDRVAIASGETTMGDVIADAQLAATSSPGLGGAVIAMMNPGGVRADLDLGPVTYEELFTVQPFGNSLVTMTLTGAQLHDVLEQQFTATTTRILQISSSLHYAWSASAPLGHRVDPTSITIDGVVVDPAASYRVTVNNFLSTGGDGFVALSSGSDRLGGAVDVDALEAYLHGHLPLAVPALDRIVALP